MPARSGSDHTPAGSAPAVVRAVAVLDALASNGAVMSLSDISRAIGVPKSSTSSICAGLEHGGLISRNDAGYQLGRRLVELGGAFLARVDTVQEFYDLCSSSNVFANETVRLSALAGTDTLVLARYEGHPAIRLTSNIGDRDPASATAQGKALLATLDDDEIVRRYHGIDRLPQMTLHSRRSVEELLADVAVARSRGYAIDLEEAADNVVGLAVAIPTRGVRSATMAVSVTQLKATYTDADGERMVAELRRITGQLGNPMQPN